MNRRIKALTTSVLALFYGSLLAQNVKKLKVLSIQKDSCCTYEIAVKNESDSIVCMLHSLFIDLTTGAPQGVALYQKTEYQNSYSLHYSFKDTLYDFDPIPYKGEWLLPYQTLQFKIRIAPVEGKQKYLSFECFYLNDFCYRDLMKEMRHVGLWYTKYNRVEKRIELPK